MNNTITWKESGWKFEGNKTIPTLYSAYVSNIHIAYYMLDARKDSIDEYTLFRFALTNFEAQGLTLKEAKEKTLELFKLWLDKAGLQIKKR